jgi:hypothetical protein
MAAFRVTRFTWQEPVAYGVTFFSLVYGSYLAFSSDPDWIGRAGSIVIVCGVLLASSRKLDVLHAQATTFIKNSRERELREVKRLLTTPKGNAPSDEEVVEIVDEAIAGAHQGVREIINERKRVFKLHEVVLVTAGTLVNGFGPWVVKQCLELS